jgi:hypothetical protein
MVFVFVFWGAEFFFGEFAVVSSTIPPQRYFTALPCYLELYFSVPARWITICIEFSTCCVQIFMKGKILASKGAYNPTRRVEYNPCEEPKQVFKTNIPKIKFTIG